MEETFLSLVGGRASRSVNRENWGLKLRRGANFHRVSDCELCEGVDWVVLCRCGLRILWPEKGTRDTPQAQPRTEQRNKTDQPRACARFLASFGLERMTPSLLESHFGCDAPPGGLVDPVAGLRAPAIHAVVSFACKTIALTIPCIHHRVCRAGLGVGPSARPTRPSADISTNHPRRRLFQPRDPISISD